jgi:ubiquinone biosynthesis protein UbiJ
VARRAAPDLATYEDFDDLQDALAPVAGAVRAHIARLARLRTGDRVLDRAARAQARMLRTMLALPALDTCAAGARPGDASAAVDAIRAAMNAPRMRALERDVTRGTRRLRRLGVDAPAAERAASFPDGALPIAATARER